MGEARRRGTFEERKEQAIALDNRKRMGGGVMLSCSCDGDYEWFYSPPKDFTKSPVGRRKRCTSCGKLINIRDDCLKFYCYRSPRSDFEERFHGDEVPMADQFMCESCGEIFLNLEAIGYCIGLGDNMKELLRDYWEITGFKPEEVV